MTWVSVGVGGASIAAPYIAGAFGKKKTVRPEDFYTPQQLAAQRQLGDFASTGQFGNFTAGAEIPMGYGDFNATGIEQQGLSSLQGLLSSGIPDQFRMGDQALQDLLATGPEAIEAQFNPFKTQMERQIRDSETAHKRSSAFGGSLYSTDTIRGLGDIQARGNETLTSELARLTNQHKDRQLQAIPLAYQSGEAQEGLAMNRIGASQQYGGLTRQLNDASIKARDAELLRRRQELQLPIQAATTLAGQSGSSFPAVSSSPYQELLGQVGQMGGQYLGNEMFLSQYKRFMNPGAAAQPLPYGAV